MDTPYRPHSQWAHLSSDIWGVIFSLVNPHVNNGLCMSAPGHKQRDQASVCALQTACKKCRAAFLQHPQLQRDVLLGSNFNNSNLPNLFEWIRLHGDAVQNLGAECESQTLMAALASLCMQKSCLKMVSLMQLTSPILDVLTFFHTLTACHLMPSTGETLSLQNLCRLPNLTSLELLDGSFTHLDVAAHLTWLNVFRSDALCCQDSLFASSLQVLGVQASTISHFHHQGISACCCLQKLYFNCGSITAVQDLESLVFNEQIYIASSLSNLTALTCLCIESENGTSHLLCQWLSHMMSLKQLTIACPAKLVIFPSFSSLGNLEYASIDLANDGSYQGSIDLDGQLLLSWQSLSFSGTVTLHQVLPLLWRFRFISLAQFDNDARTQLLLLPHTAVVDRPDDDICLHIEVQHEVS